MTNAVLATETQAVSLALVDNLVRIYDNEGLSADRFTAVINHDASQEFSGNQCVYLSFSESPGFPTGISAHGESKVVIDKPDSKHLGNRVYFGDLPEKAQHALWSWIINVYYPFGKD